MKEIVKWNLYKLRDRNELLIKILSLSIATNALIILIGTLIDEHYIRAGLRPNTINLTISIIEGLSLLYLSNLLSKRKEFAWFITMGLYSLIIVHNIFGFIIRNDIYQLSPILIIRNFIFPLLLILVLVLIKSLFIVKSDIKSFASSARFIVLIMMVAFIYGILGFMLMDNRDFHQELTFWNAAHHTLDQFDLTTNKTLIAYTPRAKLFTGSLTIISLGAIFIALTSLFQPIKSKIINQHKNRLMMHDLLIKYKASSEDFFKLWPHDKDYFFNPELTTGLAYKAHGSTALIVGDPIGEDNNISSLINQFDEVCYVNDWSPAYIHIEDKYIDIYRNNGLEVQKIGEEAIVDLNHFSTHVINNKYFRNIKNKFNNSGYSYEFLIPPHDSSTLLRLKNISNDWLKKPGRNERGLLMGYFSYSYMQQCKILIAKDINGTIQGFMNQVPSYDSSQANFDLLRHSNSSLGNINDYMLVSYICEATKENYTSMNLGLCPLSGITSKPNDEKNILDKIMGFTYANGDRLYSFSGLRKFKSKYEPDWSPRYVAYRGGVIGFTKAFNSLNRTWRIKIKSIH